MLKLSVSKSRRKCRLKPMDRTISHFVHALRNAEIDISPAETIDACAVTAQVGMSNPALLRNALCLVLAKNVQDKEKFHTCFDRFFTHEVLQRPRWTLLPSFDRNQLKKVVADDEDLSSLVRLLVDDDQTGLLNHLRGVLMATEPPRLESLRQKSPWILTMEKEAGISRLKETVADVENPLLRDGLRYMVQYLSEQVRHLVDSHFEMRSSRPPRQQVIDAAIAGSLAQISKAYEAQVIAALESFASRLRKRYRKHKRMRRRVMIDTGRTIRANVPRDGNLSELVFRSKPLRDGSLFLLCDVSGSVAQISRFTLLMTYQLKELLPRVRTFVFSSDLGEITEIMSAYRSSEAIERALFEWGNGSTDYGRALCRFRELAGRDLNHRSTVMILGDARSNFYPPRVDVLREISSRACRVIWLNPETRSSWSEGDSAMLAYAPFCAEIHRLNSLQDLRDLGNKLLTR